jgi:hypothetical protein
MTLDKHHIILYAVAIVFALGITYTIESKIADHNEQKYEQEKALDDEKDSANKQFQSQMVSQLSQLQADSAQQKAQNTQNLTTIAQLKQQLQDQKSKDATLPPTDLAARIQTLAPGGQVTVVSDGYHLDQSAAVAIAQNLEDAATQHQVVNLQAEVISRDDVIISNDGKSLDSEKAAHAADVATLTVDKVTLNQQITQLKSDARKGKLKWFGIGYVAGLISGKILSLPKL